MNIKDAGLQKRYLGWCRRRRNAMQKLRDSDKSFAEIGRRFRVSRQRVAQILAKK